MSSLKLILTTSSSINPTTNLHSDRVAGGLSRLIFIKYDNIDKLLIPTDDTGDVNTERRVISHVMSASIADKSPNDSLSKPVSYTFKTWDVSAYYVE